MILDFIRDNLNGDTWENWCDACYRDRYQGDHFVKVPADHKGDAGIEGFTLSGVVYQCYCPDKNYTVNELYTYFYNLNMAYVHIALNHDAPAAKKCIEKCKALKEKKDWLYSDAFLSAYCGHAPTTVLSKYNKALKVPYKSLVELVDYIEFVIESEPQKTTLHLAAGLIYEAMGDIKLMKQHVSIFMATGIGINQRTRALLTEKILQGSCNVDCTNDCVKCAS